MSGNGYIGGYVDPNFPNPNGEWDAPFIIYGYTPSFALAISGIVLFSILGILHTIQIIYYKTWYFLPISIGCLFEVIGYIGRSLSAKQDPYNVQFFIIQYFFIIVPPVLICASVYTILYKLVLVTPNEATRWFMKPRLLLQTFIPIDVVTCIIQIVGSALIGVKESNSEDPTTPNNILLAGLCIQIVTFFVYIVLFFVYVWGVFGYKKSANIQSSNEIRAMNHSSENGHVEKAEGAVNAETTTEYARWLPSKVFLTSLGIATLLLYIRTCYRTAETAQKNYGSSAENVKEGEFIGLEFVPVLVAVILLSAFHVGRYVQVLSK